MSDHESRSPIGVMGDTHGNLNWSIAAVRSAAREGVSTLLHVGDFGIDFPGAKRGRNESKLNSYLVQAGIKLVISPGNHDNWETIESLPLEANGLARLRSHIYVLPRGGRTLVQGLQIGGLGGAFSVDQDWRKEGKDWWANEEPTSEEAQSLIYGGPVDVLLTHDAPAGVPVKSSFDLPRDLRVRAERTRALLRQVVDTLVPPQIFCGHWHQRLTSYLTHPDGRETRVDVLNMENSREGNAVLLWPGDLPLQVEPLVIDRM